MGTCAALPSSTHSHPHSFLQCRRALPARECQMWELHAATLKTMENSKSPDEDGYRAEFYKVF